MPLLLLPVSRKWLLDTVKYILSVNDDDNNNSDIF